LGDNKRVKRDKNATLMFEQHSCDDCDSRISFLPLPASGDGIDPSAGDAPLHDVASANSPRGGSFTSS